MEKSLIIKGPCKDLADVLNIARVNGKKVLGVERVRVKPFIAPYGSNDYLVVVEEDGCSKASDVGSR